MIPLGAALRVFDRPSPPPIKPPRRCQSHDFLMRCREDGILRKFSVLAAKTDAWNQFESAPIGAVYLRQTLDGKVEALNVVCPHAGCFVDFSAEQSQFLCPCHKSSFKVDGSIASAGSPSPRGVWTV